MAPRKKPDATDTEPPEEARPDTTGTPLLVEDGKLLPPEVEFTAVTLLRWLEGLGQKKPQLKARAWEYVQALVEQDVTNGQEILEIQESWWEKNHFPLTHVAMIRAAIGTEEVLTPGKVNRFANPQGMNTPVNRFTNPQGMNTPANSSMSGVSAESVLLSTVAELMKSHEKVADEQAKATAELSLQTIKAVSVSNAKIAVQPATLNCGANGLSPSPADMNSWIEDMITKHNTINGGTRAFLRRLIRDPTGSASDFKAFLNEDERKALYVNINEKIPRALLRSLWPTNELDGTGLLLVCFMLF